MGNFEDSWMRIMKQSEHGLKYDRLAVGSGWWFGWFLAGILPVVRQVAKKGAKTVKPHIDQQKRP